MIWTQNYGFYRWDLKNHSALFQHLTEEKKSSPNFKIFVCILFSHWDLGKHRWATLHFSTSEWLKNECTFYSPPTRTFSSFKYFFSLDSGWVTCQVNTLPLNSSGLTDILNSNTWKSFKVSFYKFQQSVSAFHANGLILSRSTFNLHLTWALSILGDLS